MRVLLSAYACEPHVGSEQTKAWRFAMALAGLGHDVTVLTCGAHHRAAIEAELARDPQPPRLRFVWHDPAGLRAPGYANARLIRHHYMRWQLGARRVVRRLHAEQPFDVIHHLTWAVLRWPCLLGGLGPRLVLGPVGGGEAAPWRLRRGMGLRAGACELIRDLANRWAQLDPLVRWSLARADVILAADRATLAAIPACHRGRAALEPELFTDLAPWSRVSPPPPAPPGRLDLLCVARLEGWKGLHLALDAFAGLAARVPEARLRIAGTGPGAAQLQAQARRQGIADRVEWLGRLPHPAMPALYRRHDLFLFPSLHDTGGQALGEALAAGLPAVTLDLGGPGMVVDPSCGVAVPARGRSRAAVIADLAAALTGLALDPARRRRLAHGAIARARALGTEGRVPDFVERWYRGAVAVPPTQAERPPAPVPG